MKGRPDSLSAAVRQFRQMTSADAEGDATRARVLAEVDRRQGPGERVRRTRVVVALIAAVVVSSAALAATEAAHHRTPTPIAISSSNARPEPDGAPAHRRRLTIPAVTPVAVPAPEPEADPEDRLYGRAHAAHFRADRPERALAGWNEYLRRFPRGRFEPEARYNRALCLIRLRRFDDARQALAPFATGSFGSYRQADAERLLVWIPPAKGG